MIARQFEDGKKRVGGALWEGVAGSMCLRKNETHHMIVANPNSVCCFVLFFGALW